ncbi:hypothetical protein EDC04DRAFT_1844710 [Pisolithus marmoratus]|nr:hypothetical protein EDC04DRAFT_1844710 [Pisolithus marmoratus]
MKLLSKLLSFPTIMSLGSISNTLDDATHDALDKQVNECVGRSVENASLSDYSFLLQTVVKFSSGALDPKYDSSCAARELIRGQPGLADTLHAAWNNGPHRNIRNLSILQVPKPSAVEGS